MSNTSPAARSFAALLCLSSVTACVAADEAPAGASEAATDEVAQAAVGHHQHLLRYLGPVACEESAVLSAVLADAAAPFNPNLAWSYSVMWGYSQPSCVKGTSVALGSDYVRCSFDVDGGRTATGALRRYGETAFYFCATQRFRVNEGVFGQLVAGDTYLFRHMSGGWADERVGEPGQLCFSGMKLDGTRISEGKGQCFRGGTVMQRIGQALVGVSKGDFNDVNYRYASFEESRTVTDCGSGPGSCN